MPLITSNLHTRPSWRTLLLVPVVWLGLWYLPPGLLADGAGKLLTTDIDTSILIETILALIVVVGLPAVLAIALDATWLWLPAGVLGGAVTLETGHRYRREVGSA